MGGYPVHDNPVRRRWLSKIDELHSVDEATKFIQQFRRDCTSHLRKTYDLDLDYLWIEGQIEQRLAILKESKFSDADLLAKCTTGEDAGTTADQWVERMVNTQDKYEAEKMLIEFRQDYKPPVMPVNAFLKADAAMGSRLMELRNLNYHTLSLEELRRERGVRVIYVAER